MKKISVILMIITFTFITACTSKPFFITDENGHKQYKDKEGNFIKDGWAEISGDKYYFDLNGYLVTDQWIDNEYYVNKNGKMETNYWYDDGNGVLYYLDEDGKYVRNCIKNIDGKEYAFDKNGLRVKNSVFIDSNTNKGYYFDAKGNIDKTFGYKIIGETNCFVNESGEAIINEWREDNNKWYYYGDDGLMVKSSFVDGEYYVDEKGEMITNKTININGKIYIFDFDGKSKMERKTSNEYFKIKKYSDTNNEYITNTNDYIGAFLEDDSAKNVLKVQIIINKERLMFRIRDYKNKECILGDNNPTAILIEESESGDDAIIKTVEWGAESEYVIVDDEVMQTIIKLLKEKKDVYVDIVKKPRNTMNSYSFIIEADGFNEIYQSFIEKQ